MRAEYRSPARGVAHCPRSNTSVRSHIRQALRRHSSQGPPGRPAAPASRTASRRPRELDSRHKRPPDVSVHLVVVNRRNENGIAVFIDVQIPYSLYQECRGLVALVGCYIFKMATALLSGLRTTGARFMQTRWLSTGSEKLFLGLDSSTQGLKATALNEQMEGESLFAPQTIHTWMGGILRWALAYLPTTDMTLLAPYCSCL